MTFWNTKDDTKILNASTQKEKRFLVARETTQMIDKLTYTE